jgi:hypothetical protein
MKLSILFLLVPVLSISANDKTGDGNALKPGTCCVDDGVSLVPAYVRISDALANDDLQGAIGAAEDLGLWAECSGQEKLDQAVENLERARNLSEARIAFREISTEVIPLAKWIPGHYLMTCPMANADWIQISPKISNPYYGSEMRRCGEIKEAIGI